MKAKEKSIDNAISMLKEWLFTRKTTLIIYQKESDVNDFVQSDERL